MKATLIYTSSIKMEFLDTLSIYNQHKEQSMHGIAKIIDDIDDE